MSKAATAYLLEFFLKAPQKLPQLLLLCIIFSSVFTISVAQAETVSIVTYYGKTGGIYGDGKLNVVGNKINGRDVCPQANTNANNTPGCDMSDDPGYQKNDPNNPSDDTYTGDLIVRTSDLFQLYAGWAVNGTSDPITLTSTLPAGKGVAWAALPSSCKGKKTGLSSISADGLTMTCLRRNYDKNGIGSYSEDLPFNIKVLADTKNGVKPGELSFTITGPTATATDTTEGNSIIITAAPKWNIQKSYYTYVKDQTFNGKKGYIVKYLYYLEADEVINEIDSASAVLGNEALGENFTLEFDDNVEYYQIVNGSRTTNTLALPNAELVSCGASYSATSDPYPAYNTANPERSVASKAADMTISCTQAGGVGTPIHIKHTGIDASMKHVPTQSQTGSILPLSRSTIAIGNIEVFIPNDDILAYGDSNPANDSGILYVKNSITSFDPVSISGQSNFAALTESSNDNFADAQLYYCGPECVGGNYYKFYMDGIDNVIPISTSTGWYSGDGVLTPKRKFAARVQLSNSGGKAFADSILCDVIDTNTQDVIDIVGEEGVNAAKPYWNTANYNYKFEYATGYVGTWPPPIDNNNAAAVITECSDPNVVWHATTAAARAVGPISKVRLTFPDGNGPAGGETVGMLINLQARNKGLDGQPLPNGINIVNYSAAHDSILYKTSTNNWVGASRQLHSYPTLTEGGNYKADRAVLTRAIVRITEELDLNVVEPGDVVAATIQSTYTSDSPDSETGTVKVVEFLDAGLKYVIGSANIGDPTIATCAELEDSDLKNSCTADDQVLVWDLGVRTSNQPIEDITFNISVGATAASGTIHTYSFISSPSDNSVLSARTANRNMTVTVPSALLISKEVNTPFRNPDQSPIDYTTFVRNGASKNLTNLDIIDVLPFNGDGTFGVDFTVSTTTINHKRKQSTSYTGSYAFLSADGAYSCATGDNWFYSNTDPRQINLAPTANSNKAGGSTTWCQGDKNGPSASCGFTNAEVTAVRLTGPSLAGDASCSMNIKLAPTGNALGDVYTNNTGAYANGVSLPVMSNDVSAFIPSTGFGDTVWIDANANGIQDEGEVGVEGITLELLDPNNNDAVLKTTVTDKNGKYKFLELTPDKAYKVRATIESYYAFSAKEQGTDRTLDSNIDPATASSDNIVLNLNQQNKTIDIGVTSSLTVSGKVYKDDNINNTFDNEQVIPSATLKLYKDVNKDGKFDADDILVSTTQSDASGDYNFSNVFSGDYLIVVDTTSNIPASHVFNGQNLAIKVVDTSIVGQNFPFIPLVRPYQSQGSCGVAGFSETFGAGVGRVALPASITTSYLYNDGSSATASDNIIQDGQYAVLDKSSIAAAGNEWIIGDDATGDANGRLLMINADANAGKFYQQSISGLTVGKTYTYSINIANAASQGGASKPNAKLSIESGGNELHSSTTGAINAGTGQLNWYKKELIFVATQANIELVLSNAALSGNANNIVLDDIALAESCKDYGDAPVTGTSYGEAVHAIKEGLKIGSTAPDAEAANQPSADASGDDTNGDDEDGVTAFPKLTDLDAGIAYEVEVKVTNTLLTDANLIGWIDIDHNGVFDPDEASEVTVIPTGTNNGKVKLKWLSIPDDIAIADTFARIRLSNEPITANDPASYVLNGEVEDYPFTIEVGGFPVKGRVYNDSNVDTVNDPNEKGISGLPIVIIGTTNDGDAVCMSTKTDAQGNYQFFPVVPGNYQLYEASRESTPTPKNCDITMAKDPASYKSTTENVLASFAVVDAEITGKDFGDVHPPSFAPNNSGTVNAGNVVFYAHTFTPKSSGTVDFSSVDSTAVTTGWSSIIYQDTDCNGKLDGAEANAPITAHIAVTSGNNVCLINKVYAPNNVTNGETYSNVITADFDFGNAITGTTTLKVTDLTKAAANTPVAPTKPKAGSSKLELRKTVQNITQNSAETETQNQAKPGDVLKYRIYYSNTGTGPITDLEVNDSVPEFTLLNATSASCDTTPNGLNCTPVERDPDVEWHFTGTLQGGAKGSVSYQVTIE